MGDAAAPVFGDFRQSVTRAAHRRTRALDAVRRPVEHFGLQDYVIELEEADASHYRCEDALDLIVAETMHKALEQEPQFAVTANLAPQLAPGASSCRSRSTWICAFHMTAHVGRWVVSCPLAAAHRVPEPVCPRFLWTSMVTTGASTHDVHPGVRRASLCPAMRTSRCHVRARGCYRSRKARLRVSTAAGPSWSSRSSAKDLARYEARARCAAGDCFVAR